MAGRDYEIIVVDDDSPDGTAEVAARFAQTDSRVKVMIRREKPRDLASSVALGFSAGRGSILASLNADGSHDPADLPRLLDALGDGVEVAIGSRYAPGGRIENWPWRRRILSWAGTLAARAALGLTVRDPLSGYYALSRKVAAQAEGARGFKILLELLARGRPRALEVPIVFRDRMRGASKMSGRAAWLALIGLVRRAACQWSRVALLLGLALSSPAAAGELSAAYERVDGSYYLRLSRRPVRSTAEVELGKALFFDPRLSHDKSMSCAFCHQPGQAWTDGRPRAIGRGGRVLLRNTPTLLDLREHTLFFWDGRAARLTDQVLFPIQEHVEMGADLSEVLGRLRAIGGYRDAFIAAYKRPANAEDLARALAAFLETLETPADSAFDRGREDGAAMSAPARRGLMLFTGKARCLSCHQGPLFSDHRFHDLGFNPEAGPVDPGRWSVVPTTGSFGAFLTPSLRNVARTSPYMHDGRLTTLAEVVDFYDRGGDRPSVGALLPLGLSVADKSDLVAFLNALTTSLPIVERPVLPADSAEIPTRVSARDAAAPPRAPSETDRREPLGAARAPALTGTLGEACAASSLDQVVRASRLPVAGDAVRVYVYRALAGDNDKACAPLRGLQYDFSGVSQSAEFFCLDWYHELDLLRAAAEPVDPAVLTTACRRGLAWSYQDMDAEDVRTVCSLIVRDIARPEAVCAALTPSFIAPRLKSACEREFRLLGGSAYSCPHVDGQSWTESRCEEYSRFHRAHLAKDPSVCGKRELCRALAGEAGAQASALEVRVLGRACGRKSP